MTLKTLLDTDILSGLLRQKPVILERTTRYLETFPQCSFSLITRYEILRGLKVKDAQKQLAAFDAFCQASEILPITESIIDIASTVYANLHQRGQLIGDADILIGATAIEHGLVLSTNNENHFARIPDLVIDNWAKAH